MAARTADPHSVYGYDPDTGDPRWPASGLPGWMNPPGDEALSAARAASTANRYRVLDARAEVPDVRNEAP